MLTYENKNLVPLTLDDAHPSCMHLGMARAFVIKTSKYLVRSEDVFRGLREGESLMKKMRIRN